MSQLPPQHRPPGIELRGVTRSYGSVPALRGIDLVVQPGETVALLGPNGAGKSTTLDLVLGLGRPDRGSVAVFGLPPAEAVHRGWIGAMLQTGAVISELSVREVLTMLASLYPDPVPVDDVIAAADIADIAGRRTNRLSGGQTQRVRFALALVSNPRLLVLDEPTVALDVESRRSFWATMRGFASDGRTVVFATHYLEEADAYADRIVLMANGVLVADGSTTEIKARVGRRTIRATLPLVAVTELAALPGVVQADRHGDTVELTCTDSDAAIRALLAARPDVHDIENRGAALEDAFVELTTDTPELVEVIVTAVVPDRARRSSATYVRYEVLRVFRNRRFFLFSLVFPVVLFLLVAGPNRDQTLQGIPFPTYYMTGMVSWGTMTAVVAGGARIAAERSIGWNRQLRVSPLPVRTYFLTKLASGYLVALVSIAVLYLAGAAFDVRLSASAWVQMTALILIGLIPFAVLGILLGHVLTVESMGPALGGVTSLFALLGGAWGPTASAGWLLQLVKCLPSYWLVQAGKTAYGGDSWPLQAWIVLVVWTVGLTVLAVWVYRRDTARV